MSLSARQLQFSFVDRARPTSGQGNDSAGTAIVEAGSIQLDSEMTARCIGILRELKLPDLAERIEVSWNPRMRSSAGRATWPSGKIELNPHLTKISIGEINRTLLHELAHLIAYERNPKRKIRAHGREWQKACADVGIAGEKATHHLDLPSRKLKRRWKYQCDSCGVVVERVHKFKSMVACYHCCQKKNDGVYHRKFQLRQLNKVPLA